MQPILKSYLKRLINLTGNNRSLLFLRLSAEQDLDLNQFDFIQSAFTIIEQLIAEKNKIFLCEANDSRNASVNELSKKLRKIERRVKFIFEERGAYDLYVGWPFVQGKFSDGTPVRCPLLFFPVSLSREENKWLLHLREDLNITFNKSLLLAYAHFNQIKLKDELLDFSFEDFDKDSQAFRTSLYQLLKDSPLEINFNQDLFINKLQNFEAVKKKDFEATHKNGELKLFPEAVLGIFPQAGSYLVPDYEYMIEKEPAPDLESFFYDRTFREKLFEERKSPAYAFLNTVKEEQTFTSFETDASQENAIKAVKKGNSLVVQGPPGSGKSQLISNLISDFIARGKRVLLVSQKRAALDVVHSRLKEKDVQHFIGLVHDFKNDRKKLFDQINFQIEKIEEYKYKNNSLDAIFLERNFLQASRRIDQITEELEEFKKILFDTKEMGLSVKELYMRSDPEKPAIALKQEYRWFNNSEAENFASLIRNFFPYTKFDSPSHLWSDRVSFKEFGSGDRKTILYLLDHIPFFQADISEQLREILSASLDYEECEWLLKKEEQIRQFLSLLEDPRSYESFVYQLNKNTGQDWLLIRERQIVECYKDGGPENTLTREQLGEFQKALDKAWQAKKKFYKWIWWILFAKEKFSVLRVFISNKIKWNNSGFRELIQKVDNRMNLEHNLTELKECGWLKDVPEERNLAAFQEWIHHQHTALTAQYILKELRSLKEFLNIPAMTYNQLKEKLETLLSILHPIKDERKKWLKYFTPRQISKILSDYQHPVELKAALKNDFESLAEADRMKADFSGQQRAVLSKLLSASGGDAEKAVAVFYNSIYLEWIEHIEQKYPVLRSVSSLKMEQMENELQENVNKKSALSKDILLLKVRERTYAHVDFNRLHNMVTYRDLKHQTSKKRKLWSLRKMISSFSGELFDLIPCWMVSPEAVSAIFPMEQLFDLVIFDEASQCYAEQGIPAMYRAKQIVITGDDMQLAPNDLYRIRWEEEENEAYPELETESLLHLAEKYLLEVKLTGHYRSRTPDLIAFSNKHFYNNKLRLIPYKYDLEQTEPAISYIKTKGIWKDNTNTEEALRIAELVKELLEKDRGKSIGIVTFNLKQSSHVQDVLEEHALKHGFDIPDSLFIKNIENVQGDEKDIIIFSVGYAPDEKGKVSLQFGTLNLAKGENRLNVAVTRAREKIYVVSSIQPQQMNVDDTKNEGPRLLKKYLEFAQEVSRKKEFSFSENGAAGKEWHLSGMLLQDFHQQENFALSCRNDLFFADLALCKGNEFAGLLLTDDVAYQQSQTVKDAHAYSPLMLKEKGWDFLKVYSRQYWESKEKVMEQIIKTFGQDA